MRISCIQIPTPEGVPDDYPQQVCARLDAARGSDLIVLPELWPIGYFAFDRYYSSAVEIRGEFIEQFSRKAQELNAYLHLGSVIEREGKHCFNSSLLFNRAGELVAKYRKIHLFGYESQEAALLEPGRQIVVVDTPWGRAGLAICYDLRFPELFRAMVDQGADIFLVTSAWPAARLEAWRLLVRTRALENQALLIATNGCGKTAGIALAGHSMVVGPTGSPFREAGDGDEIMTVDVDPSQVATARRAFHALRDRVDFLNPPQAMTPAIYV